MLTVSELQSTGATVRSRIEAAGERVWRFRDFQDLPMTAVAQSLSRLSRSGQIKRVGKGIYYRPRMTRFGPSIPVTSEIQAVVAPGLRLFPAGLLAANRLGFSTQIPAQPEYSTTSITVPRTVVSRKTVVHTRRPESWNSLHDDEAAILEFLRDRGQESELSSTETAERIVSLLLSNGRWERLVQVTETEPPRVQAMLGAIGQQLDKKTVLLQKLRTQLNPLSRFNFGKLHSLKHASEWQAMKGKS